MKRVSFSEHALSQMREREIGREIITRTLAFPDHRHRQLSGRMLALRRIVQMGKLYAIIVIYEDAKEYRVITVFITSKVKKYLQP